MSEICSLWLRFDLFGPFPHPNASNTARQIFYSKTMPLLDEKAVKVVFANIEDILLTNTVRWCPEPQMINH